MLGPASPDTFTLFLCDVESDHVGRSRRDILNFDYPTLEGAHDYIQWLFPLNTQSPIVPEAPVLSQLDAYRFSQYTKLGSAYKDGFYKLLGFYKNTDHWLKVGDHNHKRISRIIGSATLLGLTADVQNFRDMLCERETDLRVSRYLLKQSAIGTQTPRSVP